MECETRHTKVHYEVIGEGKPILFLHGFGDEHGSMMAWMEPVFEGREGWKRIYLDLPGHGLTHGSESIAGADQMVEVVGEFLEKVVGDEPVALGGFSYGGFMARAVLKQRADDVRGLLLICPAVNVGRSKYESPEKVALVRDTALFAKVSEEDVALMENRLVVQKEYTLERYKKEIQAPKKLLDIDFLTKYQPNRYSISFDVDELPEPFTKPVSIVTGRQDWIAGYREQYDLLQNFPRSTFSILDLAGHFLPIERPELLEALVADWLGRMELEGEWGRDE